MSTAASASQTADGVHHDGAGEVVEGRTEGALEPALQAVVAVPDDALEQRIDQRDDQRRGHQLRIEARPLGDAAGDDGRDGGGEGHQKEELHQLVAALFGEALGRVKEVPAVGDRIADEEVHRRREREVGEDFAEGVDLVFVAHRADLEEGEAGVHGHDQDGPEQHEHRVAGRAQRLDGLAEGLDLLGEPAGGGGGG